MLIVAPTGSTKRVTRLSTPRFSSRQRKVIGRVAADDAVPAYQAEHFRKKNQKLKERDQKTKVFSANHLEETFESTFSFFHE